QSLVTDFEARFRSRLRGRHVRPKGAQPYRQDGKIRKRLDIEPSLLKSLAKIAPRGQIDQARAEKDAKPQYHALQIFADRNCVIPQKSNQADQEGGLNDTEVTLGFQGSTSRKPARIDPSLNENPGERSDKKESEHVLGHAGGAGERLEGDPIDLPDNN